MACNLFSGSPEKSIVLKTGTYGSYNASFNPGILS